MRHFPLVDRCDSKSDSSLSLPLPFYHPTPVFLPVTPQAPVSPRHQFHHHQHTCNHHANPNLLIPSSNCLSKMNWAAGSDPSSTLASGVPCPRSASSSSGLMRFPPDIAVGAHPAAVAAAAASPPQLLSPTSPLQPPPLDILPSSYHSHALRQNNAPTSAGAAADTHNRPPCPYPDYDVSASTTTALSSQMKAASANSSSSGCPATCNGGSAAAASVSDEQLPVSFEQQQQQQQHPNHRGRGRSRQRRERGSLGSPTDGVVGAAIGAAAVQQQHFFERTSVSLVRRAPSQRRHNEVEEDVSIDDEGLFV